MTTLNETHGPSLVSWIASANEAGTDFPIQNLPFGVFRRKGTSDAPHIGVAIGDRIVDLSLASRTQTGVAKAIRDALPDPDASLLNGLMARGPNVWSALRLALSRALREGGSDAGALEGTLVGQADADLLMPARIGDYTDFYTSIHHATAIGRMFRPDNPLLPNFKWIPIGYHGRSSTIGVSGQRFHRPMGQTMRPGADKPDFGPSKRLDYELELGVFVGPGNDDGSPIAITNAEDHVFGLCLFNDWSARDIQPWEYQPLGPFLAKNFASTISPWIVTLEALVPFRTAWTRPEGDPAPMPYLDAPTLRSTGAFDIHLETRLATAKSGSGARRAVAAGARQLSPCVLDRLADGGAPRGQRLCAAAGRSVRHRHAVGSVTGRGRFADGVVGRREAAADAVERRDPDLPRGRRHRDLSRVVRERFGTTHRLWRVSRYCVACALTRADPTIARTS